MMHKGFGVFLFSNVSLSMKLHGGLSYSFQQHVFAGTENGRHGKGLGMENIRVR
jgi:hypothetical protein